MPRRRNRVRGADAVIVWGIAAAFGVASALLGGSPTGWTIGDVLLLGVGAALVAWTAASAPSIALVVASLASVAASIAFISPVAVGLSTAATCVALVVRTRHANWPWARAIVGGTLVMAFIQLGSRHLFGLPTIVTLVVLTPLAILGARRRPKEVRRWILRASILVAVLIGASTVAGGATAWRARGHFTDALAATKVAQNLVATGNAPRAAVELSNAASSLQSANFTLGSPWAAGGRFIPVLAQHRQLLLSLSSVLGAEMTTASDALTRFDPSALVVANGRIDIAAVRALEQPILDLQASMDRIEATGELVSSPWLVEQVRTPLDELGENVTRFRADSQRLLRAVQVLPGILGADEQRRYFVAITSPAESRGLGGFMGSFAEVVVNTGRISVTRVESTGALNLGGDPTTRRLRGPDYFLTNYGAYGFAVPPNGNTAVEAWSNVTMPPDFPTVGNVIAQLYPQSGGAPLDGVFSIDVYGLAGFLQMTGPVTVEGYVDPLDAGNVVDFLLKRQYAIDEFSDRAADTLLQQIARATFETVVSSALPNPIEITRIMNPYVRQGRINAFAVREDEQAFFVESGMSGQLPAAPQDGFAVALNNAAPNKVDIYLERVLTYESTFNPVTGDTFGQLTISITNNAPRAGLPTVVGGGAFGDPFGSARLLAMVFTRVPVVAASIDTVNVGYETTSEMGWYRSGLSFVVPPSGGKVEIVLSLSGVLQPGPYEVVVRPQPLVAPEQLSIKVSSPTGVTLVRADLPLEQTTRFDEPR